jgi:Holliday junction resolvase RusA-like endonuclease
MTQTFTILGDPRPQGRPRFTRIDGFVKAYDPKESREYKQTLAAQLAAQSPEFIEQGKAVSIYVEFIFARPKSLPKRVEDHVKKPDLDNLIKALKDAAKGILWHDDSQVVQLSARKVYGATPMTVIEVRA